MHRPFPKQATPSSSQIAYSFIPAFCHNNLPPVIRRVIIKKSSSGRLSMLFLERESRLMFVGPLGALYFSTPANWLYHSLQVYGGTLRPLKSIYENTICAQVTEIQQSK